MTPTVENFAEMLRDEVHTLRVMYRDGELYSGFTDWTGWKEADIEHVDAEGTFTREEGFNVVAESAGQHHDVGHQWSYEGRLLRIEQTCEVDDCALGHNPNFKARLPGYIFGRYHRDEGNEHCIQIVFMDARKQHRRATRNIINNIEPKAKPRKKE